nr:hypothetical protein [Pandoravirus massiliensis]
MQALPPEILAVVLNVHLDEPWRPLAARVCAGWRAVATMPDVRPAVQRQGARGGLRPNPLLIGTHTLIAAAVGSHTRLLRWLIDQPRVVVDEAVVCAASHAGAVDSIVFFSGHNPELVRANARYAAAYGGQRAMLAWFYERDFSRAPYSTDSLDDYDGGHTSVGMNHQGESATDRAQPPLGSATASTSVSESRDDTHVRCALGGRDSAETGEWDDRKDPARNRSEATPPYHAIEHLLHNLCGSGSANSSRDAGVDDRRDWWGPHLCACAARGGHVDVLKWLRSPEVRCRWDATTLLAAITGGHAHVLDWALIECKPPCVIDHRQAIECASLATQNSSDILRAIFAAGYTPTLADLQATLLFGRTDMADLILDINPVLWTPHAISWWRHGTDERHIDRDARRRTLLWAIARLDADAGAWDDTMEMALTYAALVGGAGIIVEALRARGRSRSGHAIFWNQAERICARNPQQVIDIMRAGCTGD